MKGERRYTSLRRTDRRICSPKAHFHGGMNAVWEPGLTQELTGTESKFLRGGGWGMLRLMMQLEALPAVSGPSICGRGTRSQSSLGRGSMPAPVTGGWPEDISTSAAMAGSAPLTFGSLKSLQLLKPHPPALVVRKNHTLYPAGLCLFSTNTDVFLVQIQINRRGDRRLGLHG